MTQTSSWTPWRSGKPLPQGLEASAVLLIAGRPPGDSGWDETQAALLEQLMGRGLIPAAVNARALIMDRLAEPHITGMLSRGVAHRRRKPDLLCFRASETPDQEPPPPEEHTMAVACPPDEWPHFFAFTNQLAHPQAPPTELPEEGGLPMAVVLAGGDPEELNHLLHHARQGRPLFLIKGSGGLADELAELSAAGDVPIQDPVRAAIVKDGDIRVHNLEDSPKELQKILLNFINPNQVLRLAWTQFAVLDANAIRHQKFFDLLQVSVLRLGVFGTFIALTQAAIFTNKPLDPMWLYQIFHHIVLVVPILITVLVAAVSDFKSGNIYIQLRAGAESAKREIYRYRTRTGPYRDSEKSPDELLAAKLKEVTGRTMNSVVNESALTAYNGPIPPKMYGAAADDDGLSVMSPHDYVKTRLGDQLSYYKLKTRKLEKQLRKLQWLVYFMGAAGTLLAAIGLDLWIPLTTAIVSAVSTFLEYRQLAETLIKYNQSANDLNAVLTWWSSISPTGKTQEVNIDALVENTENILAGELAGWVQQMQDALAELRAKQAGDDEKS